MKTGNILWWNLLGRKGTDSLSWSELISWLDMDSVLQETLPCSLWLMDLIPTLSIILCGFPAFVAPLSAEVGFGAQEWPITVACKEVSGFLAWIMGAIIAASSSGTVRIGQVNRALQFCINPKPVPITNTHHLWNFSTVFIDFLTLLAFTLIWPHFLNILIFFTAKANLSGSAVQPESYLYPYTFSDIFNGIWIVEMGNLESQQFSLLNLISLGFSCSTCITLHLCIVIHFCIDITDFLKDLQM